MDLFALEELVIGYSILELNPVTVRSAMAEGEPIIFGDISSRTIPKEASARRAKGIADLLAAGTAETYFVGKDAWPVGKTLGDIDRAFLYLTVGELDGPGHPGGGAGA